MIRTISTGYTPQIQTFGIGNTHTLGVKREMKKLAADTTISQQSKAEIGFFIEKLAEAMRQYPASSLKEHDFRELGRTFKESARKR